MAWGWVQFQLICIFGWTLIYLYISVLLTEVFWQYSIVVFGQYKEALTAGRAWPGHGRWWLVVNHECRGLFYWAAPSRLCCCCCCDWCCCWFQDWAEPSGRRRGQPEAGGHKTNCSQNRTRSKQTGKQKVNSGKRSHKYTGQKKTQRLLIKKADDSSPVTVGGLTSRVMKVQWKYMPQFIKHFFIKF